jgi:hypothetical protein
LTVVGESSSEGRRFISDTKFRLNTEGTCSWLRNELYFFFFCFRCRLALGPRLSVVLWWMGFWPLDLNKTFGANGLIATARLVQVGWVEHEADGTFGSILVQKRLDPLAVDIRVYGELQFLRGRVCL